MKRYRVSPNFWTKLSKTNDVWLFLIDQFDPASAIHHLDRIEWSKSRKRLYVYDVGINNYANSFFIEKKKKGGL